MVLEIPQVTVLLVGIVLVDHPWVNQLLLVMEPIFLTALVQVLTTQVEDVGLGPTVLLGLTIQYHVMEGSIVVSMGLLNPKEIVIQAIIVMEVIPKETHQTKNA